MIQNNQAAIRHFQWYRHHAPNFARNLTGPWVGLSPEERDKDIQTADWVPNRAMWRAAGFRNAAHAQEVLG